MIPNGVISNARWNTFLVAFSSESDVTLTWEYHKLINVCCGYNSGYVYEDDPMRMSSIRTDIFVLHTARSRPSSNDTFPTRRCPES